MGGAAQVAMRAASQIWQVVFASQTLQVFCLALRKKAQYVVVSSQNSLQHLQLYPAPPTPGSIVNHLRSTYLHLHPSLLTQEFQLILRSNHHSIHGTSICIWIISYCLTLHVHKY